MLIYGQTDLFSIFISKDTSSTQNKILTNICLFQVFVVTALLAVSAYPPAVLADRQLTPMEREAVKELAKAGLLGEGMEFLIDDKIPAGLIPTVSDEVEIFDDDMEEYYYDDSEEFLSGEYEEGAEDRGGPRRRRRPLVKRKRPLRPPKAKDILLPPRPAKDSTNKRFFFLDN